MIFEILPIFEPSNTNFATFVPFFVLFLTTPKMSRFCSCALASCQNLFMRSRSVAKVSSRDLFSNLRAFEN